MRSRVIGILMLGIVCFCVMCLQEALAHPAESLTVKDLDGWYGGASSELSNGELVFYDLKDRQPKSSLSHLEIYMLAGTSGRPSHVAWFLEVHSAAALYYKKYGRLPSVLDEAVLRDVYPNITSRLLEFYRNPLTGNWPRLDAKDFSPGDLYLHVLSDSEMQWFAARESRYQKLWYSTSSADVHDLRAGLGPGSARQVAARLAVPPMYIRMYGKSGVLKTDLLTVAVPN